VRFIRQVVKVNLVHEILDRSMHFAARGGRVIPVRDTDNPHTPMLQATEDTLGLYLIARQARNIVDQQQVELARFGVRNHCLVARAVGARCRNGLVLIDLG
jgi:hypothetical protein